MTMGDIPGEGRPEGEQPELIYRAEEVPAAAPRRARWACWLAMAAVLGAAAVVMVALRWRSAASVDLAKLAPPAADLWVEFDAESGERERLRPLQQAVADSDLERRLAEAMERHWARAGFAVDWEREVRPWLGANLGVAVSGFFQGAEGPAVLGLMRVKSARKAEAFFSRVARHLEKKAGWQLIRQLQNGVVINNICRPGLARGEEVGLCYALAGRVLIVANRPSEVAGAIRRLKGGDKGLDAEQWYRRAVAKVPADALGRGVFSTEHVKDAYRELSRTLSERDRRQLEDMLEGMTTTGALWLDITGEGAAMGSFAFAAKGEPAEIRRALVAATRANVWETGFAAAPKGALAVLGMSAVPEWWDMVTRQLEVTPYAFLLQMMQHEAGVNLRDDVFGWIQGLTLAVVPVGKGPEPVGVVAELRAASSEGARARGEELAKLVCRLGTLERRPLRLGGGEGAELLSRGRPVACLQVEGQSVFIGSDRGSVSAAMKARKERGARMAAGEAWKRAAEARSRPAWFAVLADPGEVARTVERTMAGVRAPGEGRHALGVMRSIRWIAASGGADEDGYHTWLAAEVDYPSLCGHLAGLMAESEGRGRRAGRAGR